MTKDEYLALYDQQLRDKGIGRKHRRAERKQLSKDYDITTRIGAKFSALNNKR